MTTLNVGADQAYSTLAQAVAASRDGDTIAVQAGTYVNDFVTISTDVTIRGVGGMANFVATQSPPNGKGIFVTQGDVTVENLSFSGAAVADNNGAGIRYESGNLVVKDSYFHGNQMGLLANANPSGTIRITGSEFADSSGPGDGLRHNLYVGDIASLVIDDSYFHNAYTGHQIKSRAHSTTITNSRIYDENGLGSYSIDLPNGGVGVIRNNIIEQGVNTDNPIVIHYGGESAAYPGSSLTIADNVVVNDLPGGGLLLGNQTSVTASVIGNDVYGLTSSQIASGPASVTGTSFLGSRPALDTSAPWLGGETGMIFGTSGPDTLAGTAGGDTMAGLAGNDIYTVNNVGDVVQEAAGNGIDTVRSSISYKLPENVENLTLSGSGDISGTGNNLDNVLTGNGGANILRGGGGADTIVGGSGNDVISGGKGADLLTGGSGSDTFRFTTSLVAGKVDTITDFNVAADKIQLSSAIFRAIVGTGTLSGGQFAANTSGIAQDATDRIIYENDTGKLLYDSNGSAAGGATLFAKLDAGLAVTSANFTIV